MIGHLSGTVLHSNTGSLIVETSNGVGYLVYVTDQAVMNTNNGSPLSLHIHTVVREQALDLYGFIKQQEKELFELLITISGIGPKVALAILNATTVQNLVQAVTSRDSSVLTKVSGIGKKNAEKIILELENKIDDSWQDFITENSTDLDVFEALEALGYRPRDIQEVMQHPEMQDLDTPSAIKQAIKLLS